MKKIKKRITEVIEMIVLAAICFGIPTTAKYVAYGEQGHLLVRLALVFITYTLIAFTLSLIVEQKA